MHIVVKTHPGISFHTCPFCESVDSARSGSAQCSLPPRGSCVAVDASANSIFEVCILPHLWAPTLFVIVPSQASTLGGCPSGEDTYDSGTGVLQVCCLLHMVIAAA